MKRRQSTITDIAKNLKIAPSTVSRALKDSPSISKDTKEAVNRVAKELNYKPNMLAVSLLNKETKIIGVMVPEITSYFFATIINGIQDLLDEAGYKLIICQSNESYEEEQKLIDTLSLSQVDGLLVSPASKTSDFSHFENFRAAGMPVVIFDRDCPDFEADKVLVDDYDGALQAVSYLLASGCRRIAHIAGPQNLTTCQHRKQGYLDALTSFEGATLEPLIVEVEGFTSDFGEQGMEHLLEQGDYPDAIFAINDAVAIGAMAIIRKKGLKIPDDISVVGFDDEPYSQYFHPSLTTVWQPVYDLGVLSARLLLKQLRQTSEVSPISYRFELLKPELILRDSSKKIPMD